MPVEIQVSSDAAAQAIHEGFRINYMNMRDAETGRILWETQDWDAQTFRQEIIAEIPREILKCNAVSREINFSSKQKMSKFRLAQRIYFHGNVIEEWEFDFGFVIPNSTNSWQQEIASAGEGNMIPAEELSGNVVIETLFYDGDMFISSSVVRVLYV
eukprot:tig00000704_g3337.t1